MEVMDHIPQAVMAFKKKYSLGYEQFSDIGPGTMAKLDALCMLLPPSPMPACPTSTMDWPDNPSTILGLKKGDGVITGGNLTPEEVVQRPRVHRLQELLNLNLPVAKLELNCSFDDQTEAKLIEFQTTQNGFLAGPRSEPAEMERQIDAPTAKKPGSSSGKVDLPTANALLGKTPPPPARFCPPRVPGEKTHSFFVSPTAKFFPGNQELLVQEFAVGSSNVLDVSDTEAWQKAISFMARDPNVKAAVMGFTDCVASDAENFILQQQRADSVKAAMPGIVQSRVIAALPAEPEYS